MTSRKSPSVRRGDRKGEDDQDRPHESVDDAEQQRRRDQAAGGLKMDARDDLRREPKPDRHNGRTDEKACHVNSWC
jgi:hypothetical protein